MDRRVAVALATFWLLMMAFGVAVVFPPSWPEILLGTDFISFWTGGSLVRSGAGASLFDMEVQRAFQQGMRLELGTTEAVRTASRYDPFHSPPPLALLFLPLTVMAMPAAYILWGGISLSAFVAGVALPLRRHPLAGTLAVVMLSYAGVSVSLLEGQVNGLMLLAFSGGLLLLERGRPAAAGGLFGLLWLKPQYAVLFALVFLVKRRWRELAGMAAIGLAVALLSLLMVGVEGIGRYLQVLQQIGAFYPPSSSRVNPEAMANWRGLLMALAPGLSGDAGYHLMLVLGGLTGLVSLLAWSGPWDPASPHFARRMLIVSLATVVAAPHSHFHGTVLILAPLGLTLARPMKGSRLDRTWPLMLGAICLLGVVAFPSRGLSWLLVPCFLAMIAVATYQCVAPRLPQESRSW